jgi:hypothetical protein
MGKRFTITESEKNQIKKMYGLVNENEEESVEGEMDYDKVVKVAWNNADHSNMDVNVRSTGHGRNRCADVTCNLVSEVGDYTVEFVYESKCDADEDGIYKYDNFEITVEGEDVSGKISEELYKEIESTLKEQAQEADEDNSYEDDMDRNGLSWRDFM